MSEETEIAWRRVDELVAVVRDLIVDNDLTCDPHSANARCTCSTARALRLVAGEGQW